MAVGVAGPLLLWPIAVELDAVLFGVTQVERLGDAMVRGEVRKKLQ